MCNRNVLAAGAVALLVLTHHEVVAPWPDPVPEDPLPLRSTLVAPAPTEPPQLQGTLARAVLARPLFASTRRPFEAASAASPATVTPPPPRIVGTVVSPAGRLALIVGAGRDRAMSVEQGSQVGAYTVVAIDPGQVTLAGPDGTSVVWLSGDQAMREREVAAFHARSPRPKRRGLPNES